ncbi:MAG: ribosome maturation factor RimP [Gammaproteobacteria bacterium]
MVTRDQLLNLLEPVVTGMGYELVDLVYSPGRNGLLRVFVDSQQGVTLDDCESVSHQLSAFLDVEDPIPDHYTLEISSPGINRVLRTPRHFEQFAGERVKVCTKLLIDGRKRFTGRLVGVDGENVVLKLDDSEVRLPLVGIDEARLAPEL